MRYVQGSALWFIGVMVSVFAVSMIYLITAPAFDGIFDQLGANAALGPADSRQNRIMGRISNYFNIGPLILVFGLIAWGFVRILRKEGESYYDEGY